MPRFERELLVQRPLEEVFDFFANPANLVKVSPPELHMQLAAGPDRLNLGSTVTVKARRWGVPHRIVSEVTAFEPGVMFADRQRHGPFGKWDHTHRFEKNVGGTLIRDEIDFEPPGGMLGLVITARQIEKDLHWIFEYREKKVRELLGTVEGPAG